MHATKVIYERDACAMRAVGRWIRLGRLIVNACKARRLVHCMLAVALRCISHTRLRRKYIDLGTQMYAA